MSDRYDPEPLVSLRERHDLFMAALRELMKLHGVADIEAVVDDTYRVTLDLTYDYVNDDTNGERWRIKEGGVVEERWTIQTTA